MADPDSHQLLQKLDGLLAENPGSPSYSEVMSDEDYTLQHMEWHKRAPHQYSANIHCITERGCLALEERRTRTNSFSNHPFRICSLGCGDGRMDKQILLNISERFPDQKLQYLGVDINEFSCGRARRLLQTVQNVEVELITADIQELDVEELRPCDLVIAVQALCYMTSVEKALTTALKLLKSSGQMVIISPPSNPLCELCERFWVHENKRPFQATSSITSTLDTMRVTYSVETPPNILLDLTDCFADGFQHPIHRMNLDFIAQTKLSQYPASVAQTCIDYLYSIAQGKPAQCLIEHAVNWLVVEHREDA